MQRPSRYTRIGPNLCVSTSGFYYAVTGRQGRKLRQRIPTKDFDESMTMLPSVLAELKRCTNDEALAKVNPSEYAPLPFRPKERVFARDPGYVYLLDCKTLGYQKIGRSADPQVRLSDLLRLPSVVSSLHVIHADDMRRAEKHLHTKFKNRRVSGEWFKLTEDEIAAIIAIKRIEKNGENGVRCHKDYVRPKDNAPTEEQTELVFTLPMSTVAWSAAP